ncbi:helix-turn-helix transcriptional regulator [Halovivax gelatinilyticus]|uniref:helix-turn-helix transcriptional regulator n=1 Tax=Halovivax gelatinilyticus TaxID=2961597 RepID=UPI0020CA54E6|nr:helix-turn-helix domain-containing protein [Halovivax gelatinilyticus]
MIPPLSQWNLPARVRTDAPVVIDTIDVSIVVAVSAIVVILIAALVLRTRQSSPQDTAHEQSFSRADQPILTDRERVLELVDANGGRMKQTEIVDSVEWSKAKVSRLLADLESNEDIIKLRLGRENLICRPGNEPAASRSARPDPNPSSDRFGERSEETRSSE